MSLMPREKSWTKDGVTIVYRTFNTQFNLIVAETMTKAFRFPSPTEEDSEAHAIPKAVQMFYLAMPSIVRVECESGAALWGDFLKQEVEQPTFLDNPVADYKRIQRNAPAELLTEIDEGYLATREKTYLAPDALRDDAPEDPGLDLRKIAEEGPQDNSHPFIVGGGLSKKKSSSDSGRSSVAAKKAK